MPHPRVDNDTPLQVTPLFLEDEQARPSLTVVVRAAFEIPTRGVLALAEEQPELLAAGEFWGDPETSSYRYEPEIAPFKLATDVAVIAHAWAPDTRTSVMDVGVRIGQVSKGLRVFGERTWVATAGTAALSKPLPFESIPVSYDRAFGGWDRSAQDESLHSCERRNPSGRGFHGRHNRLRDRDPAPNIEDPGAPISAYGDHPAPAGFGFTSPHWLPRAELAGTYDAAWAAKRRPRLPTDFDPRFFNAGSPGLVVPSLRGDELVTAVGLVPAGRISFALPGIPPPELRVSVMGQDDVREAPKLDTVIVDLVTMRLSLLWRVRLPLRVEPNDLRAIELRSPAAKAFPRAAASPAAAAANAPRT